MILWGAPREAAPPWGPRITRGAGRVDDTGSMFPRRSADVRDHATQAHARTYVLSCRALGPAVDA